MEELLPTIPPSHFYFLKGESNDKNTSKDFIFGGATAAYQAEGATNTDGKDQLPGTNTSKITTGTLLNQPVISITNTQLTSN